MNLRYLVPGDRVRRSRTDLNRKRTRKLAFEECEGRVMMSAGPLLSGSDWLPGPAILSRLHQSGSAVSLATTVTANLTAYRPQQTSGSYAPFVKTAVADQYQTDPKLGPGIRINGDDDNKDGVADRLEGAIPGENDLIEVAVQASGASYILQRSSDANLRVWTSPTKSQEIVFGTTNQTAPLTFPAGASQETVWIEWAGLNQGLSTLTLAPAAGTGTIDTLTFHTFHSVTLAIGGETFSSNPPAPDPTYGVWKVGAQLYGEGYDVHLYNEGYVSAAYNDIVNSIQKAGETQVALFGFSHGAGDTYTLANQLYNNRQSVGAYTLVFTGYVDAIRNSSNFDTQAESRRPTGSLYHVNYYRSKGTFSELWLHGVLTQGTGAGYQLNVQTTTWGAKATHTGSTGISQLPQVQAGIHDQFVLYVTV